MTLFRPGDEVVGDLASEGIIKPVIERFYSPDRTAEAMRHAGEGHAQGKVVIKWISGG